jgi:hypothetical protein
MTTPPDVTRTISITIRRNLTNKCNWQYMLNYAMSEAYQSPPRGVVAGVACIGLQRFRMG